MVKDNEVKIWVDLETLLDVRLATLFAINPESLPVVLKNGYHTRPIDDWETLSGGMVSQEEFQLTYRDREKELLKDAVPTKMVLHLGGVCRGLTRQQLLTPLVEDVTVEVNVWPYHFTPEEEKVLQALIGHYVGEQVKVVVRRETLSYLTPDRLREYYQGVILYSFDEWFRQHHNDLETKGCPRVSFFAPSLFLKEVPDPEKIKEELAGLTTQDPFHLLELSLVGKVHLQHLSVEYYSAIKPRVTT